MLEPGLLCVRAPFSCSCWRACALCSSMRADRLKIRVLIVLVLSCYGNGSQLEARATPVEDRRPGNAIWLNPGVVPPRTPAVDLGCITALERRMVHLNRHICFGSATPCLRLSLCSVVLLTRMRKSPGGDPILSRLLVGVRVMQRVSAVHAEHHIPVCCLLCTLVGDVALCLFLIRWAYAFRFSGDRRIFILPPRDYLGGWPRCMWCPPTIRGAPKDQSGSSGPLFVFPSR